jgi:hypothetical protein
VLTNLRPMVQRAIDVLQITESSSSKRRPDHDFRAAAFPPLRPADFFCCVVPPCDAVLLERQPDPDFFPPRLEAPGEFAMRAARLLDMPFFFNPSYCFSFFTLGLFFGISGPPVVPVVSSVPTRTVGHARDTPGG